MTVAVPEAPSCVVGGGSTSRDSGADRFLTKAVITVEIICFVGVQIYNVVCFDKKEARQVSDSFQVR